MKRAPGAIALAALVLAPQASHAHAVNSGFGPFVDGVAHFVFTPQDLLPALAIGLWAGLRGARASRLMAIALPAAWLLGGLAGLTLPVVGEAPAAGAVSFLVFGAFVAGDVSLPAEWMLRLGALAGLAHGFLNGSAMAQANLGAVGLGGIAIAVLILAGLASALVVRLRAPWTRIAVRVAGSWIVAIGLLMLGWMLRSR